MIEILVVVIIISILATLAIVQYVKVVEKQHGRNAVSYLKAVRLAQVRYYMDNNSFADDIDELDLGYIGSSEDDFFQFSTSPSTDNDTFSATAVRINSNKYSGTIAINQDGDMTTTDEIYPIPE